MTDEQGQIDLKLLKRLEKFMQQGGLVELEIEMEGVKVRLKKGGGSEGGGEQHVVVMPQLSANGAPAAPQQVQAAPPPASAGDNMHVLKAPMVGTFYRSPSPQDPLFVTEGDIVKEGQTLCIIEAMKLMNEIKADKPGKVTRIMAENGQPVEFEQPILEIDLSVSAAREA